MKNKKMFQIFLCLIVATILVLTTHIYVSEWIKPILNSIMQGINSNPDSSTYSPVIIYAAYATAFIPVGLKIFLYYHTQHLLPIKSNLIKSLVVACINLELSGNLIRQPIMDIILNYTLGMKNPFSFVIFNHLDRWLSSLLLALCLVYFCPQKNNLNI